MAQKSEIEAVDRTWSRDLARKELHVRQLGWAARTRRRLIGKRTRVEHLYRWFQIWLASEEGIVHDSGALRDTIHVDGVPRKYQLAGGWTIREEDLPFLSHGPLVAEDGKTVLVPAYSLAERVVKGFKLVAAIVGAIVALLKILPLLLP